MRCYVHHPQPKVVTAPEGHRSIELRIAGIRLAMKPAEALQIANDLVDAAERSEPR